MAKAETATPTLVCPSGSLRGVHKDGLNIYTGDPIRILQRVARPGSAHHNLHRDGRASLMRRRPLRFHLSVPALRSRSCLASHPRIVLKLNVWAPATLGPHSRFRMGFMGAQIQKALAPSRCLIAQFSRETALLL